MTEWQEVPFDRTQHADFVVESCIKQWALSPYGRANRPPSSANEALFLGPFWDEHEPMVWRILDLERVRVFVDSEDPRVIWGWLATSPDESVVHEVVLKRSLYETTDQGLRDFARRLLRSALGPHLQRPTGHVGSMHVLRKLEMLPRSWFFDTLYFLKRHECKTK